MGGAPPSLLSSDKISISIGILWPLSKLQWLPRSSGGQEGAGGTVFGRCCPACYN